MRAWRSTTCGVVLLVLAATGCTDAEDGQPDTEEGLQVAVEASTEALLGGDTVALYGFLTEECRDTIDQQEFAEQMTLGMAFLEGFAEVDPGDLEVTEVLIEDFDGTTAMAGPVVDLPSGEGMFGEDDLSPWVYEDGGWKLDECPDDADLGGEGDDTGPEGLGERDQPVPVGEAIAVGDEWEVSVLGFEPDATEAVLADSEFALEPDAGERLATVRIRATYVGEESGDPNFDLEYQLVGDAATGYVAGTDCIEANDPLPNNELFPGGTAEGNVCFSVPEDESGFALTVAPWFSDSGWWFELP